MMRTEGFFGFSTSPTPVMVPPVPTPATNMSTAPPVSSQISGPVARRCASGLAGFLNCSSMAARGISLTSSAARATASRINVPGVITTSAPR